MYDSYGRHIYNLRISVTDRCNLRCAYCIGKGRYQPLSQGEHLTDKEILRVVVMFERLGFTDIRITGGEPLLRPGLLRLLSKVIHRGGIRKVSLTTNGILLLEYISALKSLGIQNLNVSLDTLRRERFQQLTSVDQWDKVFQGLEKAITVGINNLKINTVIMRGVNDDEVVDFARYTLDRDVCVRFIEYMPCGDWQNKSAQIVPVSELKQKLEQHYGPLETVTSVQGSGPAFYFKIPGHLGNIGFISPVSDSFCHKCNRMRLMADGRLKSCLLIEDYYDLKARLRDPNYLDEAIIEQIREVILRKPERHSYSRQFNMVTVGG